VVNMGNNGYISDFFYQWSIRNSRKAAIIQVLSALVRI